MSHDYPHELLQDAQNQFWFIAGDLYDDQDEDDGEGGITFSKVRGIGGPFASEDQAFETMVTNFGNPGHSNGSKEGDSFFLDPIHALMKGHPSKVKRLRGSAFKDAVWNAFDNRKKS